MFATHDLTTDPAFSKLDLIICCDVLGSLQPLLQQRVLASFHYGLKDTGFLLLGRSERPKGLLDLFATIGGGVQFVKTKRADGRKTLHAAMQMAGDSAGGWPSNALGGGELGEGQDASQPGQKFVSAKSYFQSVLQARQTANQGLESPSEDAVGSLRSLKARMQNCERRWRRLKPTIRN